MTELPSRCGVLVVGAGPAGSACAQALAKAGIEVLLVDQHHFPRDKVCGDGLIPDSHRALARLGVLDAVKARAAPISAVHFVGPRGGHVDVPGTLCVLPRRELDHLLVQAAVAAGAQLATPWRFMAPIEAEGRVVGARLKRGDETREVFAHWVVLATGAVPQALLAAGLCERRTPSGVALRGYVHAPGYAQRHPQLARQLQLLWHPQLRGGYGWIFPAPDGRYNIGTGLTNSHGSGAMADVNLRAMLDTFCRVYAPAADLMAMGSLDGELKGAPLRCSLQGARWSKPGVLVTGEAAGSTYDFSGEGIGKAMETGLLAAEALLAHGAAASADAPVRAAYEAALAALRPKFALYEVANRVNRYPWLADLIVWRAKRSERIRRRLAGVLEETQNPGRLFTFSGLSKLLFE